MDCPTIDHITNVTFAADGRTTVYWTDTHSTKGITTGNKDNPHIKALIARWQRAEQGY